MHLQVDHGPVSGKHFEFRSHAVPLSVLHYRRNNQGAQADCNAARIDTTRVAQNEIPITPDSLNPDPTAGHCTALNSLEILRKAHASQAHETKQARIETAIVE